MSSEEYQVHVFANPLAVARGAAEECERRVHSRLATGKRVSIALAGGSTPLPLYELLASEPYRERLPWIKVHLFWGDERAVPPNHEDSNFGMAWRALISKLRIPPGNVHRLRGELDPDAAAREYERELRGFFEQGAGAVPRFDLVLLGLGADGHTASLFPGSELLEERERLVAATPEKRSGSRRLTLTCPVLNNAACIMFIVTGEEKVGTLRAVLEEREGPARYPAQLIQPDDGELLWYVDRAAARSLSSETVDYES